MTNRWRPRDISYDHLVANECIPDMATGVEYAKTAATLNQVAHMLKREALEGLGLLYPGGGCPLTVKINEQGVHLAFNRKIGSQVGAN